LTYGYNLGRSGGVHLKEVYGYSIIFIVVLIFYFIINFISKKNFLSNNNLKQKRIFVIFFVISTFAFSLNININNILNFKNRFIDYIYLADDNFIHKNDKSFLNNAKTFVQDFDCVQMFSNDVAYLYLLRKKNCTKYYLVFSLGSYEMQKKMIYDMKNTELIISSKYDDKGHPTYKLHLVNDFIENNFEKSFEENNKIILKKIN